MNTYSLIIDFNVSYSRYWVHISKSLSQMLHHLWRTVGVSNSKLSEIWKSGSSGINTSQYTHNVQTLLTSSRHWNNDVLYASRKVLKNQFFKFILWDNCCYFQRIIGSFFRDKNIIKICFWSWANWFWLKLFKVAVNYSFL